MELHSQNKRHILFRILPLINLLLFIGAVKALTVLLKGVSFHDLINSFDQISPAKLIAASVVTIINYIIMIGYDAFGLKYAGSSLKFSRISFVSFIGDSFNANLGLSAIVGSTVKMRLYSHWGEKIPVIAKSIAIYTLAYWLGFSTLVSLSLFGLSGESFGPFHLNTMSRLCLGGLFALPVVCYLTAVFTGKDSLRICKKISIPIPSKFIGLGLLATGIFDWICNAAIFFILMPGLPAGEFFRFGGIYSLAHLAGMISQIPGGMAVFETTALFMMPSAAHASTVASLLTFRFIFFIAPFIFAIMCLGIFELKAGHNFINILRQRFLKKGNDVTGKSMIRKPSVTVVVPAYNEEISLPACLKALLNQNYDGKLEILVVNNASTDSTPELAEKAGCRVVHEYNRGYNHAVARGFSEANGDIIACTDADTIVPDDWISHIVKILLPEGNVACSGVFRFNDGATWIKTLGWLLGRCNYHLAGANMAVWKDAYIKAGGFSQKVNLGADVELGLRLKKIGGLVIDRSLIVWTSARRFQSAFWRTVFRYYLNDLSLLLFKRPIFYSFRDYRLSNAVMVHSPGIVGIGVAGALMFFGFWSEQPTSQLFGTVLAHGKKVPAVALTFDDGPGVSTDSILKILKQYDAHATFFLIGENARQNPGLVRKILDDGNEIGNHTFSHPLESMIETPRMFGAQLDSAENIFENITGTHPSLFRPPKGWRNPWMMKECKERGYTVVTWTMDSRDWLHYPANHIFHRISKEVKPGSIILMHDRLNTGTDKGMSNSLAALPLVLDDLTKRGYHFVTISELESYSDGVPISFNEK